MAEQWITASQALEIGGDAFALCSRLYAGLIKARAKLLRIDGDAMPDIPVPKQIWWAQGHAALEQDWQTGDFATWIDRDQRIEAFGVKFALDDVLEMIAVERRPIVARNLSVAGNPAWVSAQEALRICYSDYGHNPVSAREAIIVQAKLGFIVARAVSAEGGSYDRNGPPKWNEREWDVPTWFWNSFDVPLSGDAWVQGNFCGEGNGPNGITRLTLNGLYFYRESLCALGSADDPPKVADGATKGRKPVYDWEGATAAIWGQIFRGELIPKNQAEVEKAFQRQLAKGDKEPGESTVRPYANRVWEEFSR